MKKDLTSILEQLEAFEDRLGIKLEALYASLEDDYLTVNGELHSNNGTELEQSLELVISAYDKSGRIVSTTSEFVNSESFYGFETFSSCLGVPSSALSKIRIYPKGR